MGVQATIALLGNVDHEGIVSALKTSGYVYEKKLLESSHENWASIVNIVNRPSIGAVLVKLTPMVYRQLFQRKYEVIGKELFTRIGEKRNAVFVHDSLWSPHEVKNGKPFDPEDDDFIDNDWQGYFRYDPLPLEIRAEVNGKLKAYGLEPICYSTNAQLTVMGTQFVQEIASRLLFRVYIPHGRLYATETDRLLQLFKEFLDNTGRQGITLNKVAAEQGTSFEFCGEYPFGSSLADDLAEFSSFMNMCVSDVDGARNMLATRSLDEAQVSKIITRYTKEARRLTLDITHERELKILEIRHRLESELVDVLPSSTKAEIIRTLVDRTVPSGYSLEGFAPDISSNVLPPNLTLNINPQIVGNVYGHVTRDISGNVSLGTSGQQLLELVAQFGAARTAELTSYVHEIADGGVPEGARTTKTQKLKSFLYGLGPEIAKSGLHILEEYLKVRLNT